MHLYSRSRREIRHKGASSGNFQRVRRFATTATATRSSPWSIPRARPATGRALLLLPRPGGNREPRGRRAPCAGRTRAAPLRGAGHARANPARPASGGGPPASYTVELLDDPEAGRRQGPRGGGGGGPGQPPPSRRRAAEEGADVLYHPSGPAPLARRLDGRGAPDPERSATVPMSTVGAASLPGLEPGLDRARELAEHANLVPVRYRFVEDCETAVSAFLKLRGDGPVLARVRRAGPLDAGHSSGPASRDPSLGGGSPIRMERRCRRGFRLRPSPPTGPGMPRSSAATAEYLGRYEIAEPDELPPFAGGAVGFFGSTSSGPSSRSPSRTPIRSRYCPTWP